MFVKWDVCETVDVAGIYYEFVWELISWDGGGSVCGTLVWVGPNEMPDEVMQIKM